MRRRLLDQIGLAIGGVTTFGAFARQSYKSKAAETKVDPDNNSFDVVDMRVSGIECVSNPKLPLSKCPLLFAALPRGYYHNVTETVLDGTKSVLLGTAIAAAAKTSETPAQVITRLHQPDFLNRPVLFGIETKLTWPRSVHQWLQVADRDDHQLRALMPKNLARIIVLKLMIGDVVNLHKMHMARGSDQIEVTYHASRHHLKNENDLPKSAAEILDLPELKQLNLTPAMQTLLADHLQREFDDGLVSKMLVQIRQGISSVGFKEFARQTCDLAELHDCEAIVASVYATCDRLLEKLDSRAAPESAY